MKTKLYFIVKNLLINNPITRDSDRELIWSVLEDTGYVKNGLINKESFINAPSTESIRRLRQKFQEKYPEMRGSDKIMKARTRISKKKGNHIYSEEVTPKRQFEVVNGKAVEL